VLHTAGVRHLLRVNAAVTGGRRNFQRLCDKQKGGRRLITEKDFQKSSTDRMTLKVFNRQTGRERRGPKSENLKQRRFYKTDKAFKAMSCDWSHVKWFHGVLQPILNRMMVQKFKKCICFVSPVHRPQNENETNSRTAVIHLFRRLLPMGS